MTNVPSGPVTVSRTRLVPTFLMVTVAPGMTPPPASVTTPDIWPVSPCAASVGTSARKPATTRTVATHTVKHVRRMRPLLLEYIQRPIVRTRAGYGGGG